MSRLSLAPKSKALTIYFDLWRFEFCEPSCQDVFAFERSRSYTLQTYTWKACMNLFLSTSWLIDNIGCGLLPQYRCGEFTKCQLVSHHEMLACDTWYAKVWDLWLQEVLKALTANDEAQVCRRCLTLTYAALVTFIFLGSARILSPKSITKCMG